MSIQKIRTWRWIVEAIQALLIIGLPFVAIKGESVLRFDLPSLRLHVFGASIWMQEFFLVLIAIIALTILFLFVTHVFGRIWCGWLCPQTVITDFTFFVEKAGKKGLIFRICAYLGLFLVCVLVAASIEWYFVSPYEFLPALFAGKLGTVTTWIWGSLSVILFLDFAFLRHKWCKTICPYAMLQSVMFDKNTMIIELDPDRASECINCSACVKVCPTRMDIRNGFDAACINCAECIDACTKIMGRMKKKGLIRYAFGAGNQGALVRKNSVILGGLALIFLVFLGYLFGSRTGVTIDVLPHRMEARVTKDQMILNAYVLSVKNTLNVPLNLAVKVTVPGAQPIQSLTAPIHLDANYKDVFPLFVKVKKVAGMKTTKVKINLTDTSQKLVIDKEANFVVPDEL